MEVELGWDIVGLYGFLGGFGKAVRLEGKFKVLADRREGS